MLFVFYIRVLVESLVVVENELMMTRTTYDSSEAGGSITKLFAHANDLSPNVVVC